MNDVPDLDALLAHRPFVEALVRRLLRDEHLAEDVVQETWLASLKAPASLRSAQAWLHRVAKNLVRRTIRDRARAERRERALEGKGGAPGTDALFERLESHRQVVEAVSALEPHYRTVILLRFYENLPPREIARRTGEAPSTVRTRLQRALEMLRGRLDRAHRGDGRTWAIALLPLLRRPGSAGVGATGAIGGTLAMKKLSLCVVVLALAATAWVSYRALSRRATPARSQGTTTMDTAREPIVAPAADDPPRVVEAHAEEPPAPPAAEGTCVGIVHREDGTPLAGAVLSLGNNAALEGTTDAEGRLRVAGEWTEAKEILLRADDGAWFMTTGTVARPGTEVDLTLEQGITVTTAIVAREDGAPVPGARVFLGREDGRKGQGGTVWARADENGIVRIDSLPRSGYRFEISADGFEGVLGAIDLVKRDFPARFELAPARVLTVRIEDLPPGYDGREVAGFVQRVGGGVPRRFREKLDPQGEFRIPAPPVGGHMLVVDSGDAMPRLTAHLAIGDAPPEPVVLKFPSGVAWTGVVLAADGTPWANREIRIDSTRGEATTVRTDEEGRAQVPVLPPGKKTVVVMIFDGWFSIGTVTIPAQGALHSELRLPGSASVTGRVVRGAVPDRTPLILSFESDRELYAYQIPDADGRIAIDHLAAGSYDLETRGESAERLRTIVLRDGETVDLGEIDLGVRGSAVVEVAVPEGTRMPECLTLRTPLRVAGVWLDERGRGTLGDLPPGTHTLRVTTPGFAEVEVTLTVPSKEPVRIQLEPVQQGGR